MKTDRLLIAIVAGIGLLVVVAFVLALVRPAPAYRPDDAPEGVVHNYLLALQNDDYERAYGYLSPNLRNYPADADEFADEIDRFSRYNFERSTFRVNDARVIAERATVPVTQTTFTGGGLFNPGENVQEVEFLLRRESGKWKITRADIAWVWCWSETSARCP